MKKLLLISFVLIGSICNASSLEFSQVLFFPFNATFSQTVPKGKVWKIESVGRTMNSFFTINGIRINLSELYSSGVAWSILPIWLPAGSVIAPYVDKKAEMMPSFINITEYNVVP